MKYKVLITNNDYSVNELLDKGWSVHNVIPQIATGANSFSVDEGQFCFVLTREE